MTSSDVIKTQRRNKQRAVEYLGGKCSICGYNRCLAALDFHHVDPLTKEASISHAIHCWSWKRAKKEVDKCILVCSNCHREIHNGMYEVESLEMYFLLEITKCCLTCKSDFITKNEQQKFCCAKCRSISQQVINRPSKDELYKLVWDKPTIQVAEQFGVSDKAVEKWCKSYGIEKPGNGYWTKKKYGLI